MSIPHNLTEEQINVLRTLLNQVEAQEETKIVPELTPQKKLMKSWKEILDSGKRVKKSDILNM